MRDNDFMKHIDLHKRIIKIRKKARSLIDYYWY